MRRRTRMVAVALGLAALAGLVFRQLDRAGAPTPPSAGGARHGMAGETAPAPALPEGRGDFAAAFRAGLVNLRAGDAHAAARAFEKAVAIRPHAAPARINLGFAALALDRPAAAAALFERALEIAPMAANGYYGLAAALDRLGDRAGAMGAMRAFLHLAAADDPFRRRAMAALGEWEALEQARPAPPAPSGTAEPAAAAAPRPAGTGVAILDAPLVTLDGAPASLAAHRGRIAVVNVWATWCGPCRLEIPSLDRLAAALDPARFAVVGVSLDREGGFVAEYLRETGIDFPSYRDAAGRFSRDLVGATAIPLTLILSPEGEVLLSHEGARDWGAPETVAAIRALDGGTAPLAARLADLREVLR